MTESAAALPGNGAQIEAVAIVGMAGRFPDAVNVADFWRNLQAGRESVRTWADEELEARGVPADLLRDSRYVPAGVVLDDIDMFDADFFGMSATEAQITDPQQRLLLECAWAALEDAAHPPSGFDGPIAVYAGKSMSGYLMHNLAGNPEALSRLGLEGLSDLRVAIGNDKDYTASLVSYKLGLRGPSVTVQTACSTSLVAVHLACQDLLSYRCDLALAGGVSLNLGADRGYLYREGGILSPDGHCRVFDAKAQGIVRGSGAAMVTLRRLSDARASGDRIYAVIKGSAINNDGNGKVGFAAPSMEGQCDVILQAMALAEAPAESIGYVEAHGTGTRLGDPIELAALTEAYRMQDKAKGSCWIGSVKANVGHLDVAAGVTGLIKASLCLHHGQIPPQPNFEVQNPAIDFKESPFQVSTRLSQWERTSATPRRAGISSFGVGGTNVHMVLEEGDTAGAQQQRAGSRPVQVLVVSGKSEAAAAELEQLVLTQAAGQAAAAVEPLACLLQMGRTHFAHRRAIVVDALPNGRTRLTRLPPALKPAAQSPQIVFMFPGQGSQYPGMARGLLSEPVFRREIESCIRILAPQTGWDPSSFLLAGEANGLWETDIAQPVLFSIEYALARLWMHWGIRPQAMIGHSLGEYVAACLAGVFTLEDALRLVVRRGQLMRATAPGAMLVVRAPAAEISMQLPAGVSLAADNSRTACVVSGARVDLDGYAASLKLRGVDHAFLQTTRAFHSSAMDPILDQFAKELRGTTLRPPQLPFVSNLTGGWMRASEATDPARWVRHLREPVQFRSGIELLAADPERVFLEVGPGSTLRTLSLQHPASEGLFSLASLPAVQDAGSDQACIARALAGLWQAGAAVDWRAFSGDRGFRGTPAPTYPFQRRRYWIESSRVARAPSPAPMVAEEHWQIPIQSEMPGSDETPEQFEAAVREAVAEGISEIWLHLLGVAEVDPEVELGRFGADSLLLVQFRARVQHDFRVDVPIEFFVPRTSIAEYVNCIVRILIDDHQQANRETADASGLA